METATDRRGPRVALLGDIEVLGLALGERLAGLGLEVPVLPDPDAAYLFLRSERRRLDLLIVDVCQLEFDGLGVLGWLKVKGLLGDVPVWIIEDPFEPTSAEVCQACGIARCLSKSATADDIADCINEELFQIPHEKRRHPRVAVSAPVVLGLFEKKVNGLLTDVSVTGAFVETAMPFAVDTRVSMRFELPGSGGATSVRGRVVRVNLAGRRAPHIQLREGMGLEFEGLSGVARAAILGYLERHGGASKPRATADGGDRLATGGSEDSPSGAPEQGDD